MLDDPDAQARMALMVHLMSDDGAFNSRELAVDWPIRETHYKTDHRGKLHTPRHAQVQS